MSVFEHDGSDDIEAIWEEFDYPRLLCLDHHPLCLRVPPEKGIRQWLREDENGETLGRRNPKLHRDNEWWELPTSWRDLTIRKLVGKYGAAVVISQGNAGLEKCAESCWRATSDVTECTCSCGGIWHGCESNPGGFYVIGDALAVRWSGQDVQAIFITSAGSAELASASIDGGQGHVLGKPLGIGD